MKIRSRGLGRRELAMDTREFKVVRSGKEVELLGVTHAPVTWETNIRMRSEDIGPLVRLVFNRNILYLVVRWVFHRKTPDVAWSEPQWQRRNRPSPLGVARPAGAGQVSPLLAAKGNGAAGDSDIDDDDDVVETAVAAD